MSLATAIRSIAAPVVLLAAATACTSVFETTRLSETGGLACRSSAGGYFLPKVLVRLSVSRNDASRGFKLDNETPKFQTVSDRRHQPYCLDYLASPTSKDLIAVERGTNGLLQKVVSNVEDRSTEIALKLIDTASNLTKAALRSQTIDAAEPTEKVDVTFDPFDPEEMTEVNRALYRFGFCAYIENHSFPHDFINAQRWCSTSDQARYANPYNIKLAMTPVMPEALNTGILYRPNATHKLVILRKTDPGGREPWALFMTKHIEMPNVSPIFSIGVSRALFATRNTELSFANGVLTNIKIDKTSELENFTKIPLAIAQAIVKLPTEIIQLRIDDTSNATSLANKEMELAAALAALSKTRGDNPGVADVPDRQGQLMEYCQDQGASPADCRTRIVGPSQ